MTVGQRLCDALYAAGRIKEAGEALLNIVSFFDEDVYMAESVISWFSGRLCCLVPSLYTRHSATDHHFPESLHYRYPSDPLRLYRQWKYRCEPCK